MKDELYHFYFDEGGIFGDGKVLVTSKKLPIRVQENHFCHYYKGKMPKIEIALYIDRWKRLYPRFRVIIETEDNPILNNYDFNSYQGGF